MGSLLLKLTVDASGKVVSVDPLASQVTNTSFTKTVVDDVRKWKFPKAGVEAAEITVPLLFVPKGMDPDTVVQWERKVRSGQEDETSAADLSVANKTPFSPWASLPQQPLPIDAPFRSVEHNQVATVHVPEPKI
jgi:hypothetical protein